MRANANVTLRGSRCVLVPYRPEHVETYHAWMLDPETLAATASEPLTMEEEIEAQRSWANDETKLTFIVLDVDAAGDARRDGDGDGDGAPRADLGVMCGDVNLYWNVADDVLASAEIEVMVAEKRSRRKGIASEALEMCMAYAWKTMHVTTFVAKIGLGNAASLALFTEKLGFRETSRETRIFREATAELSLGLPTRRRRDDGGDGGDGGQSERRHTWRPGSSEKVLDDERARVRLERKWEDVVVGAYDEEVEEEEEEDGGGGEDACALFEVRFISRRSPYDRVRAVSAVP